MDLSSVKYEDRCGPLWAAVPKVAELFVVGRDDPGRYENREHALRELLVGFLARQAAGWLRQRADGAPFARRAARPLLGPAAGRVSRRSLAWRRP